MAQLGEQLAKFLRNGKVVMSAISSPKKSDGLASGSPNAPPSQGPEIVADELTSGLPQRAAVARAGGFWGGQAGQLVASAVAAADANDSCTRGRRRASRRFGRAIFAHFPGLHTGETEATGTGAAKWCGSASGCVRANFAGAASHAAGGAR